MAAITAWALDVAQRTIKTFAQTLVGMLGAGALSVLHVDWRTDLAVAAGAALVCVLQNVSSFPVPKPSVAPATPATWPVGAFAPRVGPSATGANGTVTAPGNTSGPNPNAGTATLTFPPAPPVAG